MVVIGFYISEISGIITIQGKVRERFVDSAYISSIYNHVKEDKKLPLENIQENINKDKEISQTYKNYSYNLEFEENKFNLNILKLDIYKNSKIINSLELVV